MGNSECRNILFVTAFKHYTALRGGQAAAVASGYFDRARNMLRRPATRLSIQNEDLDELLNVGAAAQQQAPAPQAATTGARIGLGQ